MLLDLRLTQKTCTESCLPCNMICCMLNFVSGPKGKFIVRSVPQNLQHVMTSDFDAWRPDKELLTSIATCAVWCQLLNASMNVSLCEIHVIAAETAHGGYTYCRNQINFDTDATRITLTYFPILDAHNIGNNYASKRICKVRSQFICWSFMCIMSWSQMSYNHV